MTLNYLAGRSRVPHPALKFSTVVLTTNRLVPGPKPALLVRHAFPITKKCIYVYVEIVFGKYHLHPEVEPYIIPATDYDVLYHASLPHQAASDHLHGITTGVSGSFGRTRHEAAVGVCREYQLLHVGVEPDAEIG